MTAYSVRHTAPPGVQLPDICLQCQKLIGPSSAGMSLAIKDQNGYLVGNVHLEGSCKEEWLKDHPTHKA
jgi:hypothetical protein